MVKAPADLGKFPGLPNIQDNDSVSPSPLIVRPWSDTSFVIHDPMLKQGGPIRNNKTTEIWLSAASILSPLPGMPGQQFSSPLEHYSPKDLSSASTNNLSAAHQGYSCVCAFDFDNTLRVPQGDDFDAAAGEGPASVQACQVCHRSSIFPKFSNYAS
jgi:hypothetical protein